MANTSHEDALSLAAAKKIEEARRGSGTARGDLLEACRNYLLLVANRELDSELRAKLGPSDLVQETFVQAQQFFGHFEGKSEAQLCRAWLTRILLNRCHDAQRAFCQAEKRHVDCEHGLASNYSSSLTDGG